VTEDRIDQHTIDFVLKSLDRLSYKIDVLIEHDIKTQQQLENVKNEVQKEINWLKNELQTNVTKMNEIVAPSQDFMTGLSSLKKFSKFIIYFLITLGAIASSMAVIKDRFLP
jgi:hypothetical protein